MTEHNTQIQQDFPPKPILLVCGLSGAGRSTALQVFEDLQFFTVDGIPSSLITEFANLAQKPEMQSFKGFVLGIDMSKQQAPSPLDIIPIIDTLQKANQSCSIIFLEASNDILLKRYATTRRPHPYEKKNLTLESAIIHEREALTPLKDIVNLVLDTSNFSLHDLRRALQKRYDSLQEDILSSMHINLISFGFKYGVPKEADMVYDMRHLPNPYFVEELRPLNGKDKPIVDYIFTEQKYVFFRERFIEFIKFNLPYFESEGRYRLCLAIGCTGGQHRSVAMTEFLHKALVQAGYAVTLEHRHLTLNL